MWLCLNYGFFSVVKVDPRYADSGDNKLDEIFAVRARQKSHLIQAFGNEKLIFEYPYSDYEYRVYLTQQELHLFVLRAVDNIQYTNFKNSVKDNKLHDFFVGIWHLGVKYLSN
jgi:hypothetical protein